MTVNLSAKTHIMYDQGNGTWKTTEPSGGTIIVDPMMLIDFTGLSDGQSVVPTANDPGSVENKRFDACLGDKGFFNGYGIQAKTGIVPGYTSAARCSIASGSDGDPAGGDTGAAYGAFGGILEIKDTTTGVPQPVSSGEEFWYGFYMYLPEDFSFETNTGALKYIRHDTEFNVGRIENMIVNGFYNSSPLGDGAQVGWGLVREGAGNDKLQSETHLISNKKLILGGLNWVEMYMKPYFDRSLSVRRIWLNGEFVCERVGNVNKYINNSGVLTTQVIGEGDLLLSQADDAVTNIYFSTYWNGGAPQNQAWDIVKVVGEKNPSKILGFDEYDNKMMGPQ